MTPTILDHLRKLVYVEEELPVNSLLSIGGSADISWEALSQTMRALGRFVLTVAGPKAEQDWRAEPACSEETASHTIARCFHCHHHALWGGCAHTYVAFRVMGKLQDCVQGSLYFKHASICIPLHLRKLVDLYGLIYLVVC